MKTPRSILREEMEELGVMASPYWSETVHWGDGESAAIYDILWNLTVAFEYSLVRDDLKAQHSAAFITLKDLEKKYAKEGKKKGNDAE